MPVTTREYAIATPNPVNILAALETALADLGWHAATAYGYLQTITTTPGSVVRTAPNLRYLVAQASSSGTGTGAMFDVLRNGQGGAPVVTVVTGGSGYRAVGLVASSAGVQFTVASTTDVKVGQVVTKIAGTGTLLVGNNTVVVSVDDATHFSVNVAPSVAFSGGASILLADTVVLSAASIGGSTYVHTDCAGTAAQATLTVLDPTNVQVGQRVTGTGIGLFATVLSIAGTLVTLSVNHTATITNGVTSVTFSDEILCTVATVAYAQGITGTITGQTITAVLTDKNIPVGARVNITSGAGFLAGSGTVLVNTVTGTGPYVISLINETGDFKGFNGSGAITFDIYDGGAAHWMDYNVTATPSTVVWGCASIVNDGAKKLGKTFWTFTVQEQAAVAFPQGGGQPFLYIRAQPGFNPNTDSAQGVSALDWFGTAPATQVATYNNVIQVCSSGYATGVKLRTYQSSIDPNFVVFTFVEGNACRSPFFLSKYANAIQPWDLDHVFLGGSFEIFAMPTNNTNDAGLNFRIRMSALPKRQAEAGYSDYSMIAAAAYTNTPYHTSSGNRGIVTPVNAHDDISFYSRQPGDLQSNMALPSTVFKTIPICPFFLPVPYYIPNDFVLAETPYQNGTLQDTITVTPGVEVYTAVQAAINPVSYTALAFAARTT